MIGISRSRVAGSAALRDTARLGRFGSAAKRGKAGVTPDVDPEHVRVLVDAVHELSAPYHA